MEPLIHLWRERKVLRLLVRRDLRVRYSQSVLGYLWTIIDPLANALIYFMLFVIIFQRQDAGHHPYFLFLVTGLLPWQWFNSSVSESMRSLIAERQLVKSTKLPREIWIIRVVASKGLEFLFALPVLILFMVGYLISGDAHLDWELLLFPVAVILQFILLAGIGLALAPLTVLMFDIQPTVRIFLRIYFYLTPIIFNLELLDRVPDGLRWVFQINPLTGILELYRGGFFAADIRWPVVGYALVGVVAMFLAGITVFRKTERAMLKEI